MSKRKALKSRRSAEAAARQFGQTTLDNKTSIATPENVAVHYEVAGPFPRVLALLIDYFVVWLVLTLFGILFLVLGAFSSIGLGPDGLLASSGIYLVLFFAFYWFYMGILETYWNGRTLGKYLLSLRVLTVDGRPINGAKAILRNLIRLADTFPAAPLGILFGANPEDVILLAPILFPLSCGVGLVVMSMNRRYQRLGDLVAGTMVIHEPRKYHHIVERFEDQRVVQLVEYIPASFVVSNELASTLSLYAERRGSFSPERTREIAAHLGEPLLHEFGLPPDTSHDLLLCALYYRTFLSSQDQKEKEWRPPEMPGTPAVPVGGSQYGYNPAPAPTEFGSLPPGFGPRT